MGFGEICLIEFFFLQIRVSVYGTECDIGMEKFGFVVSLS